MAARSLERFLADEAATFSLGEDLAMAIRPGDVLLLDGDLGAGKTTLARSLIRALADNPRLEVPSPTFTLVQSYDTPVPLHHFDLYRLSHGSELDELGFEEMLSDGAVLVEWPDRGDGRFPRDSVHLALEHEGEGRRAMLSGEGPAFERMARSLLMRDFLKSAGYGEARRARFVADASARWYETVDKKGEPRRVLMNSPRLVLGPPVRDGKPYAEIAHTSQTVAAFVALDKVLAEAGVSVPQILAQDLEQGFLLLDHLGTEPFLVDGEPVAERYAAAAELLADLHDIAAPAIFPLTRPPLRSATLSPRGEEVGEGRSTPLLPVGEKVAAQRPDEGAFLTQQGEGKRGWPASIEVAPDVVHVIPPFDRDALMIEVELLLEWYVPAMAGAPAPDVMRRDFLRLWNAALDRLEGKQYGLVLRDYHSPNIVWRDEREGHDRLGILDFQDALIGPVAYDVASLAMDARVTVPEEIEQATVEAYVTARQRAGSFDEDGFREAYAITAAQRNSKILGIFVRLNVRDGKSNYLKHLPRIRDYMRRALAHPALEEMRDFYERNGLLEERST
ncbi:tRNA (adenosine(37)-N6)-threonylcarbamoyltransferase complex ATPase subunit type 1 TsaE [Oryzicola mucosus]|uniref:tRNA (adenosine(37)-N6)-threonylcarbamoyltransferase complex ATPase subunit type 1 TsaE n=1 Tax=Oryzicola mucosus TaxID=2767425 RepID=UPI001E30EA28|nr:tRNA (adenosine(37)-N6)-threonylcarbamoyltransferase complex ATPase subunit type 1 TsaE [Oryzicola mucosus]